MLANTVFAELGKMDEEKKTLDERKVNHYSNDYGKLKFKVIKF